MTTATLEQPVLSGQAYAARAALLTLFAETAAAEYDPHPVAFRTLLATHLARGRGEISVEAMMRLTAEAWEMATGEYPAAERHLSDALVVTNNFHAGWSITWKPTLMGEQVVLRCSSTGKLSLEIGE